MIDLRSRVEEFLKDKGMNRAAFARHAHVSAPLLSRFLRSKEYKLSVESERRIEEALERPEPPQPFAGRAIDERLMAKDLAFAVFDSDDLAGIPTSSVTRAGDRFLFNGLEATIARRLRPAPKPTRKGRRK